MIYLASPYTHRDNNVMQNRYMQVAEATSILIAAGGRTIYSPIVHFHPIACLYTLPRDIEFWWDISRDMLNRADEFWVLMLDEWERSIGIMRETVLALERDITLRYLGWEDRSAWPK